MFEAFSEFSTSLSISYPLLWALFVMAVVAVISLVLFFFWEAIFRLLPAISPFGKGRRVQ
ncbi:MAG: hypothetical protein VCB79_08020 [Dehalococcoidia bacterium]